jgi:hypothetical protein
MLLRSLAVSTLLAAGLGLAAPAVAGDCPAGQLSAAESYHAGIVYSRPRGNLDPDRDPPSGAALAGSHASILKR